jgi:hypothetical protein
MNALYTSKPRTLQDVRREIEIAFVAVPLATTQKACQLLHIVVNNALLLVVDILNICDRCENITILFLFVCAF